ncbi:MAG TPA: hypothetical protein PKC91_03855 [Ignavibacteria bacterium]|nr:hypothetical protein [Ignavibacteria bacterium]
MKPTQELYDLIKSLTGSEKRYFKLNASKQKGNKNYLKLFDAIDSQKHFDENEMKRRFKNEKFILNLTVTKNYLYSLIIKNLVSFNDKKSVDIKLANILFMCKLIFDKALYKQFFKASANGKELAIRSERFSYVLEFIEFEKNIMKKEEIGKKDMNKVYDEEIRVMEIIKNINTYKRAVSNLFRISRTVGRVRDKITGKLIDEIVCSKDFNTEPLSLRAGESLLLAKYLESRLKGNYREAVDYCKQRFELISEHPEVFKDFLLEPGLDSLEFLISSYLSLNNFGEAKKTFKTMKKAYLSQQNDFINFVLTEYDIRLSEAIENRDLKASVNLIREIENFLKENKGKIFINTENYFYFSISKYYFVSGNYEEALRTINDHLSSKYSKLTPEFESYQRILNIMIHYELGNYDLLKYLIPSAKKFLKGKKKLFRFESAVLKYIRKIINAKEKKHISELLMQFHIEAAELKKDEYERNAFEYFDLTDWIESKIKNINK